MTKNLPSIRENLSRLDELLAWFDSDNFSLEESLQHFKEAETLAATIETQLSNLQNEVQLVRQSFDETDET